MRAATTTLSPSKVTNLDYWHNLRRLSNIKSRAIGLLRSEKIRGRTTCRIARVFTNLCGIDLNWLALKSFIQVERIGIRSGKKYLQTNYYISSLVSKAANFANGIRQHWGIENRLHWVKDVIFGEDAAPFRNSSAATNWSIIRNIAINLARKGGYDSLTKAQRFLAHDIEKLFLLLE